MRVEQLLGRVERRPQWRVAKARLQQPLHNEAWRQESPEGRYLSRHPSELERFWIVGTAQAKKNRGSVKSCRGLSEEVTGSEEEAEADLDLAASVSEIAVGVGNRAKGRVKRERGGGASAANEVAGAVDVGDVLMVENVESFPKSFDGVVLAKLDALGKAQVHVDGALHLERIAADDVDAFAAVGAVDATAERSVGDGGNVAGDGIRCGGCKSGRSTCGCQRIRKPTLSGIDGRKLPIVGEVAEGAANMPWTLDHGTGNNAVGYVEDGVAIFRLDAGWHEQVVGVGESRGILAKIERMGPGVAAHELKMAGHSTIQLDDQGVVLGIDGAEDIGHRTEVGVRAAYGSR